MRRRKLFTFRTTRKAKAEAAIVLLLIGIGGIVTIVRAIMNASRDDLVVVPLMIIILISPYFLLKRGIRWGRRKYADRAEEQAFLASAKEADAFGPVFARQEDAAAYFLYIAKSDFQLAERLRQQQIIRESLQIALSSKNPEVAEGRMNLAKEKYEALAEMRIPKDERERLDTAYIDSLLRYRTARYLNEDRGHLDKMRQVKTGASKQKYASLARAVLAKGLDDKKANRNELISMLKEVKNSLL